MANDLISGAYPRAATDEAMKEGLGMQVAEVRKQRAASAAGLAAPWAGHAQELGEPHPARGGARTRLCAQAQLIPLAVLEGGAPMISQIDLIGSQLDAPVCLHDAQWMTMMISRAVPFAQVSTLILRVSSHILSGEPNHARTWQMAHVLGWNDGRSWRASLGCSLNNV